MKLTTPDLERSLRQLGDGPAPEPDTAFAATLEDRLRSVAHLHGLEPSAPVRRAAGRRSFWLRPATVSGLAFAVLAAGFALAQPGRHDDGSVRVAAASNSLVVLPDGTVDAAIAGALVPDGSTLKTGEDGHLVAGGVAIGPNHSVTVSGGAIKPASGGSPIPPAPKPVTTTTTKTLTTQAPPVGKTPQPDPGPGPAVTTAPTTATTFRPAPGATTPTTTKPAPVETTKTTTTPDTKPPSTDPAVRPAPAQLKLEALYADTKVRLVWSPYDGADFEAYLVLREGTGAEPTYPVSGNTTVVARITQRSKTESPCSLSSPCMAFWDNVPDPANQAYRIVALDRDRRVVAVSPVVRPTAKYTTTTTAPTAKTA